MRRRSSIKRFVGALGVLVVAAVLATVLTRQAQGEEPVVAPPKSTFSMKEAVQFANFPLYSAGDSVEGLPLVAMLKNPPAGDISFIYGDCKPTGETGCAPPIEIQVWPACKRNPSLYDESTLPTKIERTVVRGVPAISLEDGARLEIQTGISTVVIFGRGSDEVLRVAAALQGVNVPVNAKAALPAPALGAQAGDVPCKL